MTHSENSRIPCFLCGALLQVKQTKNDKPYFICEPCGLQTFVRCKPGIKKLQKMLADLAQGLTGFLPRQKHTLEILSTVSTLNELETKLIELKDNKSIGDYLFPDDDQEVAQNTLECEIKKARKRLKQLRKSA